MSLSLVDFVKELFRPIPNLEDIRKKQDEIELKVYKKAMALYSNKTDTESKPSIPQIHSDMP